MATQNAINDIGHMRAALKAFESFKEDVLDKPPPDHIHPGLYRAEVIRNHHITTNDFLKPDAYESPLGSIAAKDDGMYDDVADAMLYYPWTEVYGLSYLETWQLPYKTWIYLYNTMRKKYPKGRLSFNMDTAPPTNPENTGEGKS